MRLPLFQVDAFTDRLFGGNPAAVVLLERWLDDATLQAVASENNLSETAFLVGGGGRYEIRWMTPTSEVDLCGHATLASAWVVCHRLEPGRCAVSFESRSGPLRVESEGERLALDFPARPAEPAPAAREAVAAALGRRPSAVLAARDYLAVFESDEAVRALRPDMARTAALGLLGVTATAAGTDCDFVSRCFFPSVGIPEDPVTGSAHCTLVPFWSRKLGKSQLHARQLSQRGGELWCLEKGDRVSIAGRAVPYLEGTIEVLDLTAPAGAAGAPVP